MSFWRTLRQTISLLSKNPRYFAMAALTLALGVAATTVIFSLINATLLQTPPFYRPDRLLAISEFNPAVAARPVRVSAPDFADLQKQRRVFEAVAAYRDRKLTFRSDEPRRIEGTGVTEDFFRLLGTTPSLGRTFVPEDEGQRVVVLSYRFWHNYFANAHDVLGRSLDLDDQSYTIIGVMPPRFHLIQQSDVWVPLAISDSMRQMRGAHFLDVIARRRAGVSLEQVQAAMGTLAHQLAHAYPGTNSGWMIHLESLTDILSGHLRKRLLVLFGAVVFVLLITCSNISGLLLARTLSRQREFAIRLSLGATRPKIVGQVLAESLVLGAVGGTAGVFLGYATIHLMPSWSAIAALHIDKIRLDGTVLGFAILASVISSFLFSMIPAFHAANSDLNDVLKRHIGRSGAGVHLFRNQRMRGMLIIGEIALAQVLLIGAGLFGQSFLRLQSTDPGFEANNIISMEIPLAGSKYSPGPGQLAFYQALLEQAQRVPGVQLASVTNALPLSGTDPKMDFAVEGQHGEEWASARIVSPGYFATMKIPLVQGRDFTQEDNDSRPKVVVVNQTLAKQITLDGISSLGKKLRLGDDVFTITGVVGDVRERSLAGEQEPAVYFSLFQNPQPTMALVARTNTAPLNVVHDLRAVVHTLDRNQPVENVATGASIISHSVAAPRFSAILLGILAILALILAMVGIYGVMSYSVEKRTHEIGIYMALGAQTRDVMSLVLKRELAVGLLGAAIGFAFAIVFARTIASLLFGISATNIPTFLAVSGFLFFTTLAACFLPALRASRVTPVEALRSEA